MKIRFSMGTTDFLIVGATLLGPILAVQAQKWVESARERKRRKLTVFERLMATRMARLAPEHVQALNMIDLAFYGGWWRRKSEATVLTAWKEYLDHLGNKPINEVWAAKSEELFTNLLSAIARDLRFSFDRVQLSKGAYSPVAHGHIEEELNLLRTLTIKLLSGETNIKMSVTDIPAHPDALALIASQKVAIEKLVAALDGNGALSVSIQHDDGGV